MNTVLEQIVNECRQYTAMGQVATYIPQLAVADPNKIGICAVSHSGEIYCAGDCFDRFTVQSVIKPLILLLALMDSGPEKVRALVGVEATGKPFDAFNYSDLALTGAHINPMINTGAIALCTLVHGETYEEKFLRLLELTRRLAGNREPELDRAVYLSEKKTGSKNRALVYMLKAYGMIDDPAEELLDCYFKACSILVSCRDLAQIANVFAHHGKDPVSGEQLFPKEFARYVNATLVTCGMYDGSGEFALNVGFPAKSGVGGGIMGVIPNRMGVATFSPALDKRGNSVAGIHMLEKLSRTLELSIF
ncbi:MAG: glutaminase A [Oscillospiraceae bacterium]|nr:glutaminase A [Oscillospiraceae bacterium]